MGDSKETKVLSESGRSPVTEHRLICREGR